MAVLRLRCCVVFASSLLACFPDPPAVQDDSENDPEANEETTPSDTSEVAADAVIETTGPDTFVPADTVEPDTTPTADTAEPDTTPTADTVDPDTTPTADTAEPDTTPTADTAEPDTTPTADTVDPDTAEPDTTAPPDIDPCPGGCTHLDEACQVGVCTESGCIAEALDGPCDDGLRCTTLDRCVDGTCVGDPVICEAKDGCHIAGICDPATGLCSDPRKPDTTPCDDADPCTEHEACAAGVCTGGQVPDDSEDWFVTTSEFGPNELRVQSDGTVWWFVTLVMAETEVGTDDTGTPVVLTLPVGAVRGVAAVHYDVRGTVRRALVLGHTPSDVQFLGGSYSRSRVVRDPLFGEVVIAVVTFKSVMTIVSSGRDEELESTSGAPRSYAVLFINEQDGVFATLHMENPSFTEAFDPKNGVQPGIAIGPAGQTLITMSIGADLRAEIVDVAELRAPAGQHLSWLLYFSRGQALGWQRALVGRDPTSFVTAAPVAFDDAGHAWVSGVQVGQNDWRRTDTADVIGSLPVPTGIESYLARISPSADLHVAGRFSGGLMNRLVDANANAFGGASITFLVSTDLDLIDATGSERIVSDPSDDALEFAVVELDAQGELARVVRNPGLNLHRAGYHGGDLVLATIGGTGLLVDDVDVFPPVGSPVTVALSGVASHAWSFLPVSSAAGDGVIWDLATGLGDGRPIAQTGVARDHGLQVGGRESWSVEPASGFIAVLNSEGGRICADR